ncbi:MAG: DUF7336 domain-containing protein [Marinilabiliaceae bacterium]
MAIEAKRKDRRMKFVFLLWHIHKINEEEEDSKLIGVYSSKEKAMKKIEEYKNIEGFKENPEGFEISEYQIDSDHWEEGFVTVKS